MKIFKSLAIITAVVAIAGAGTYAWLSDTASVNNSTFATESLNILIDKNPAPDSTIGFELPESDAKLYSIGFEYKISEKMKMGSAEEPERI